MPKPKKKGGEGFQPSTHPFAYTMVLNPLTGESIYQRTVSPQIPDSILQTGNRRTLENFYIRNRDKLTAADKRYLGARIHTAAVVDKLEKKALEDLADGKPRPTPQITTKRGYQGIDMKLPRRQSSNNGCWSCGLELLLKSRGVELSQEEIRAFRPNYPEGQERMGQEQQYSTNRDTGASPYDFGDLVLKVLPNTCVRSLEFQPVEETEYMSLFNSQNQLVFDPYLLEQAAQFQKEQTRKQFVEAIRQGLFVDRSPVILNRGGSHFVTITGISEDGKRIRFEDSFPSNFGTKYASVDELIEKYMAPGMHGLGLSWVRDLPVPQKQNAPETTQLLPELGGAVTVNNKGEMTLSEEGAAQNVYFERQPNQAVGMLDGTELTRMNYLDQTELQELTGCSLRNQGLDQQGKPLHMIVNDHTYLPKRTWLPGDPDIRTELTERQNREAELDKREAEKDMILEQFVEVDGQGRAVLDPRDPKEEPAAGSLDAFEANQKHSLNQQAEGTASFIANLYALQVYRASPEKQRNDEKAQQRFTQAETLRGQIDRLWNQPDSPDKTAGLQEKFGALTKLYPHLNQFLDRETGVPALAGEDLKAQLEIGLRMDKNLITPALQKKLDAQAAMALPVIKDMLGEKKGGVELPMTAVRQDAQTLVNQINQYAENRYYIRENPGDQAGLPDWVEKKQVINSAVTVLRGTGTGKNALGFTRKRNSPAYEKMLAALEEYKGKLDRGLTPSGMENRMMIQHCLDYVSSKMDTRSNESSGQRRFDTVMGVLGQIMPPRQYDRLLRRINQARSAKPGSSEYVSARTYAPKTADNYCFEKGEELLKATGLNYKKICSELLAAKLIAAENPRQGKTLIEDPANPALKETLQERARLLRSDPKFEELLSRIPRGGSQKETADIRRGVIGDGTGLYNAYTMPEYAAAIGVGT